MVAVATSYRSLVELAHILEAAVDSSNVGTRSHIRDSEGTVCLKVKRVQSQLVFLSQVNCCPGVCHPRRSGDVALSWQQE